MSVHVIFLSSCMIYLSHAVKPVNVRWMQLRSLSGVWFRHVTQVLLILVQWGTNVNILVATSATSAAQPLLQVVFQSTWKSFSHGFWLVWISFNQYLSWRIWWVSLEHSTIPSGRSNVNLHARFNNFLSSRFCMSVQRKNSSKYLLSEVGPGYAVLHVNSSVTCL